MISPAYLTERCVTWSKLYGLSRSLFLRLKMEIIAPAHSLPGSLSRSHLALLQKYTRSSGRAGAAYPVYSQSPRTGPGPGPDWEHGEYLLNDQMSRSPGEERAVGPQESSPRGLEGSLVRNETCPPCCLQWATRKRGWDPQRAI